MPTVVATAGEAHVAMKVTAVLVGIARVVKERHESGVVMSPFILLSTPPKAELTK